MSIKCFVIPSYGRDIFKRDPYVAFIIVLLGVAWFAYLISIIATVIRSRKRDVDQDVNIGKMQKMEVWMNRYERE
jgi:hypothetical protein